MATELDARLQKSVRTFVEKRVKYIRSGNRRGLDATYSGLDRQNKYNRHDYQWYLDLIERGFDEEIAQIDIEPCDASKALPFAQMVTYPWPPDFRVFVETASGRRTLWLVRMVDGHPKVVLPAFNGRTADCVARGDGQLPRPAKNSDGPTTTLKFLPKHFISAVAESVSLRLDSWAHRLKFETIRAAAIDCAPWHGQCCIALLTTQEDFTDEELGKWAIGDWRWSALDDIGSDNCQLIRAYYEGKTITDLKKSTKQRAEIVFSMPREGSAN